ncbi:MAG TPA: phenylacetaldoxime dehydratase family protein, partial [Burkholderiaceae bacterium]|nr:phenylacetaldoxime dehydratase family protein [Burkholderiaceae bacterium]
MESAIPEHLQCPRTRHRRVGDDYIPPYPSFVARHAPTVTCVVMAYFGVQWRGDEEAPAAGALRELAASFDVPDAPGHWDRSRYVDEAGFSNVICAAYWDEPARFERWFAARGQRWTRQARAGLGTFTELV